MTQTGLRRPIGLQHSRDESKAVLQQHERHPTPPGRGLNPLHPHCRQIRASRGLPTHEGVWGGSPNKLFPQRRRGFFLQPGGQVDDDQVHAGGTVFGIQQGYPVFAGQGRAIQGIAGLLLHP